MCASRMSLLMLAGVLLAGCQAPGTKTGQYLRESTVRLDESPVQEWVPQQRCTEEMPLNKQVKLRFHPDDARVDIVGIGAVRAHCRKLPTTTVSMDFWTEATFEALFSTHARTVFPSFLFLDEEFAPIADLRLPPVHWGVRMSSAGLAGQFGLRNDRGAIPAYVVAYLAAEVIGTETVVSTQSVAVANIGGAPISTGTKSTTVVAISVPEGMLTLRALGEQE